jgi:23S rRNA (guanosine2251-2'-O)-methyltransferase
MNRLSGIHAVHEALLAGRALERILIARGKHGNRLEEIVRIARDRGVPVRFEDRSLVDRLAETRDHQGVIALTASQATVQLEDLLSAVQPPGLLVLLDGIEDPHNLGAIMRSALAAGAGGAIIPERRSAGLTQSVARASAGAIAHLRVARVKNLVRAMELLKEAGYWLIGLDESAEKEYSRADYTGSVGIVLGGEGHGLHQLTRKHCDFFVGIPTSGPVRSLNASVAASIVLFEAVRQRRLAAAANSASRPA